jgi:hypothetical protein
MTCNYRYYKNNDITGLTGSTNDKKGMCTHNALQASG